MFRKAVAKTLEAMGKWFLNFSLLIILALILQYIFFETLGGALEGLVSAGTIGIMGLTLIFIANLLEGEG